MIRDAASQRQVDASDPHRSTWLSANAGSGKTHVLTNRVARLLLTRVSPQNILCLTYTKAAAAEMQNRLFNTLGRWAMLPDPELRRALHDLGFAADSDADDLAAARRLFARAIETPGGLKIQTIHSFCGSLLRRFPLEAGVSPQFREIEEHPTALLRADVLDSIAAGPQAHVVTGLLRHFTGASLDRFTAEIAARREVLAQPLDEGALRTSLDLPRDVTLADLHQDVVDRAVLQRFVDVCANGTATEVKAADRLRPMLAGGGSPESDLATLEDIFLTKTKNGQPCFEAKIGILPTKPTQKAHPDLTADLKPLMERVELARPQRLALLTLDRTRALYDFVSVFLPAYTARKMAMGVLDFDDLIIKARDLLTHRDTAQWVLFRLDGGIDHILLDEAQDTSPVQWALIDRLSQEFTSGQGAQPNKDRTLFVVGDKKQSIYSFQGADPAVFDHMADRFDAAYGAAARPFARTTLDHSFRSAQTILTVVDQVLAAKSPQGRDDTPGHIAFKDMMPGRVDLWPIIDPPEKPEETEWYEPVDLPGPSDHIAQMAARVAGQIKHMIAHDTIPVEVEKTGTYRRRAITAGDFLVLVQGRTSGLFDAIIRACKAAGLDTAGADRLKVAAELAVRDITALLQFLALPEDDLSLAAALRSPLLGWSEQDLFTLAHHRPAQSYLWQALRASDHHDTLAMLQDLRGKVDYLRPYDLIERILIRHDGRRSLLARLGPEAEDGIDALLSQALSYETAEVPSLTGFLVWMQGGDLEIKRQMDAQGDRIRVMTVHGAKGLEAPIVILPDTAKRKNDVKDDLLAAGDQMIWKPNAGDMAPAVQTLRDQVQQRQARERLRLLYVAMTRAEKWLIIGAAGDVGDGGDSWYSLMADGMAQRGVVTARSGDLTVRRVADHDWDDLPPAPPADTAGPTEPVALPQFGPLPIVGRAQTLRPSQLPGPKVMPNDGPDDGSGDTDALERGTALHLLLEHLPGVPADERTALGAMLLGPGNDDLIRHAIALIARPDLAWLWDPQALTEVAISADIPKLGRINGTVDRLIVTDERVTAIDYKSNRLTPDRAQDTPLGVLRQIGSYAHALAQIYPDRQLDMMILWTQTGHLMALPNGLLQDALDSLPAALPS